MKRVKLIEINSEYPSLEISPLDLVTLYLSGVEEYGFISEVIASLATERNGGIVRVEHNGILMSFSKKGSSILLKGVEYAKVKKPIAMKLLMSLTRVLSSDKTAIDISTAA